jgi:hypothetical protein
MFLSCLLFFYVIIRSMNEQKRQAILEKTSNIIGNILDKKAPKLLRSRSRSGSGSASHTDNIIFLFCLSAFIVFILSLNVTVLSALNGSFYDKNYEYISSIFLGISIVHSIILLVLYLKRNKRYSHKLLSLMIFVGISIFLLSFGFSTINVDESKLDNRSSIISFYQNMKYSLNDNLAIYSLLSSLIVLLLSTYYYLRLF